MKKETLFIQLGIEPELWDKLKLIITMFHVKPSGVSLVDETEREKNKRRYEII